MKLIKSHYRFANRGARTKKVISPKMNSPSEKLTYLFKMNFKPFLKDLDLNMRDVILLLFSAHVLYFLKRSGPCKHWFLGEKHWLEACLRFPPRHRREKRKINEYRRACFLGFLGFGLLHFDTFFKLLFPSTRQNLSVEALSHFFCVSCADGGEWRNS